MTQTTGGHYLDTGDGPARLDPPTPEAEPARRVSPQEAAWSTYQAHQRGCQQCQGSVWRCADGNELWQTYIEISR